MARMKRKLLLIAFGKNIKIAALKQFIDIGAFIKIEEKNTKKVLRERFGVYRRLGKNR